MKKSNISKAPSDSQKKEKPKKNYTEAILDVDNIVESYQIRKDFSGSIIKEAETIPYVIPEKEVKKRVNLRNQFIVTIDGADAKDLDDAVSIEKTWNGWLLGVHIADVSYYVPENGKLDQEALKRGNSYYFINKVIPMFPKNLSNTICSLNPKEDRLTLSVFMKINKNGQVVKYNIQESIIHSKYRLTYEGVQKLLDGHEKASDHSLLSHLKEMQVLFQILNRKRVKEGSIDFEFKEQKCLLDEKDEPVKLWLKDRLDSERIIEEFMLLANQTVAKFLSEKGVTLYRIHGEPESEKIKDFVRLAMKFGHKIYGVPIPEPHELQRILKETMGKPHKELIHQVLLRSMQQAKYDINNIGHFGLGFDFYTHFTSPIRRYADLIVHRLIRHIAFEKKKKTLYTEEELSKIAVHISRTERTAMEAERDLYKIKAIRFMQGKEGEKYDGSITGVSSFGIFVQILKYGVEGLVRYADIEDDYYFFDENNYCAIGKKRKKRYMMGDNVKIIVKKVNVNKGYLDFSF